MNALLLTSALLVMLTPPIGDGGDPVGGPPTTTNFNFDTTAIETAPAATLPKDSLMPQDFDTPMVATNLLEIQGPGKLEEVFQTREILDFPAWSVEIDPQQGKLLALRKPVVVDPVPQDEQALRADALRRLTNWGVAPGEIYRVMQRRMMEQHENDQQGIGQPRLSRYKTFVLRGVNGVPVEGHRAVLTYHLDGSFHRALVIWPALAIDGHKLMTDLDEQAIVQRATKVLVKAGETDGDVTLSWHYIPQELESGEVTLKLVVAARLAGEEHPEATEEPRVLIVPVSAY